ncbi:tetratricopeptide repeat protein [Thermodesulfobacteriota bacterium]
MGQFLILQVVNLVLGIVGLVVFIMVLIKLFKNEGILKGIFGLICGIYPFIWGWIKHKELKLTRLMTIWTAVTVLSIGVSIYFFTTGMSALMEGFTPGDIGKKPPSRVVMRPVKRPSQGKAPLARARKPAAQPAVKTAAKPAAKSLDFDLEMKKINNLIKLDDKNAEAFYNRGWLFVFKGDLQSAEKDYSKAISIKKKYGDAYYNRGLIYAKMKKYEQALSDFSEVVQLKPLAADALCNRGNIYFEMGKTDLAIKDYSNAQKISTQDPDIYYNRGIAYKVLGDQANAEKDFKKAAELGHGGARKLLGLPPLEKTGPSEKRKIAVQK